MQSWAAIVSKRNEEERVPNTHKVSAPAVEAAVVSAPPPAPPLLSDKAAARQRLLTEALKSRSDARTGQRWCLACGRAFAELSRLAQHIADAHFGVNSPPGSHPEPRSSTHQPLFQLKDVAAFPSANPPPSAATAPQKPREKPSAPRPAVQLPKPAPQAFSAPAGTHAKRRKRSSRLKRSYQRAKAVAAVEHWFGVLATIEESLQLAGELLGAVQNEIEATVYFAAGWVVGEAAVRLQVLREKEKLVEARLEELTSVHASARKHLARTQSRLEPLAPAAAVSKGQGSAEEPAAAAAAAAAAAEVRELSVSHKAAEERGGQSAAASAAEPAEDAPEQLEAPSEGDSKAGGRCEFGKVDTASEGPESECSTSLGGFQNVLGQWAALSGPPKLHQGRVQAAKQLSQAPAAAAPVVRAMAPKEVAAASSGVFHAAPTPTVRPQEAAEPAVAAAKAESGSNSSSSSSSRTSSGSSLGLQWGDALQAWARTVGVEARTSLRQSAAPAVSTAAAPAVEKQQEAAAAVAPAVVPETPDASCSAAAPKPANPLDVAVPQGIPEKKGGGRGGRSAEAKQPTPVAVPPPNLAANEVQQWLQRAETSARPESEFEVLREEATSSVALAQAGTHPAHSFFPFSAPDPQQNTGFAPLFWGGVIQLPPAGSTHTADQAALRCDVCQVALSGPRAWEEHVASRRHASRVAATAAQAVSLPKANPSHLAADPASAPPPLRYVGAGADVAPYVDHVITPELNSGVEGLLRQLLAWQERTRQKDPMNAKRKRRVVSGMREVEKAVKGRKAKALIVAPNIKATLQAGGEGEEKESAPQQHESFPIAATLAMAAENEVPVVFALSRQRMGRLLGARKTASAFAVLDVSGAEQQLREVLAQAAAARSGTAG